MDACGVSIIIGFCFIGFCCVYVWQTSSNENKVDSLECRINTIEKNLKSIHDSLGKVNAQIDNIHKAKFVGHWELEK